MSKNDEFVSDFLFARPSFIEGVGRILDVGNVLNTYNGARTPVEADARAINQDWRAIGRDVRAALEHLRTSRDRS